MADERRVQQLLDDIFDTDRTPEQICGECPELLAEVRRRWQKMCALHAELEALFPPGAATVRDPSAPWDPGAELPRIPGHEVEAVLGHGGVGVVYTARDLRLWRRVALKMLLAGAYAAPADRSRFLREAEAVASLQHPNIVQVHGAGEYEGRLYFTMEYVEGGSLHQQVAGTPQPARQAAALVATIAEAVHVAHQRGIVHRDLKPANILLTKDGTPKLSDFGLARRLEGGVGLTQTGVPMGTPSYMAPEQARGDTREIGPAVDTYALGAILYELLTGRPPFRAETSAETLRQVISESPVPPSQLNPAVPRDVETICLKCLEKEPRRRYESAAALAEDLHRFQQNLPILARPVGRAERTLRWARRNPTETALLATAMALIALASGGGAWIVQQRAERRAELRNREIQLRTEVGTDLAQAEGLRKDYHFQAARKLLEQARQLVDPAGPEDLRRQVDQARDDLALVENLDTARLRAATPVKGGFDPAETESRYRETLAKAGLGQPGDDPKAVSAQVRNSAVRGDIVAALDDWASITEEKSRQAWLLAVARGADPDPVRDRLRQPELWRDPPKLTRALQDVRVNELSPRLLGALGRVLNKVPGEAIPLLSAAQARHPQDFWLNYELAGALWYCLRHEEALGYLRASLAIRPESGLVHDAVGENLRKVGRVDEGIAQLQEAIRRDPKNATARYHLAYALWREKGRLDEAIEQYQQALSINPKAADVHYFLAGALGQRGREEEAIVHLQQAVRLDPYLRPARFTLQHRMYSGARDAALTAAGEGSRGTRLSEQERASLRRQALDRLRIALEQRSSLLKNSKSATWGWMVSDWLTDPALAGVRGRALMALPDAERQQWQRFWTDAAALIGADPVENALDHAKRREWGKAAECYARALKLGPADATDINYEAEIWFEYAAVLLLSGDRRGYAKACAHMVERCGKTQNMRPYHVARACTLAEGAVADLSVPGRLAKNELEASAQQFWSQTEQGALHYRAGRFQQAVALLEQSLHPKLEPGRAVVSWLWLALAQERLGKREEARRWLDKATAWLDQYVDGMPARAEEELGLHLHNWLEAHVLRREAEAVLGRRGRIRIAGSCDAVREGLIL